VRILVAIQTNRYIVLCLKRLSAITWSLWFDIYDAYNPLYAAIRSYRGLLVASCDSLFEFVGKGPPMMLRRPHRVAGSLDLKAVKFTVDPAIWMGFG